MQETESPAPQRVSSRLRLSALGAALAVLSSALVVGQLWSVATGTLMALAGAVLGIVALSTSRKLAPRGALTLLAVLAIVWGGISALSGGVRLLVWPASQAYQDCMVSSLTLSARNHCERQLTDNVWNYLSGSPVETGPGGSSPDATGDASPSPAGPGPATTPPGSPAARVSSVTFHGLSR